MEHPRVSVITIFLNAGDFLEEAIASVLAQTYPHWELLLVDDGSTDDSTRIARESAAAHPTRIRYLEHPDHRNLGMSASRNSGLREARGEFVAFLDADDVWLPGKLERQVRTLDEHPEAAMVYNVTLLWHSWKEGGERGADSPRLLGVPPDTLVAPPGLIPLYLRGEANPPATCGALIRRSAALAVGGFEEDFRGMFEDQVFFYKLALAHPVYVMGGYWDLYRQHPASHCSTAIRDGDYDDDRPNESHRVFMAWLERYLASQGGATPEVLRALHHRARPYRRPRLHAFERSLALTLSRLRRALGRARR